MYQISAGQGFRFYAIKNLRGNVRRHGSRFLWLRVLCLVVASFVPFSSGGQPEQRLYLKVVEPRIPVEIEDAGLKFDVGSRVRYFQETGAHFIGVAETSEGEKQLFAVPSRTGDRRKIAWVTPEKMMFFGFPARTCAGRFILIAPEKLPVLEVLNAGYRVHVERYGETAVLHVPKTVRGVELVFETVEPPAKEAAIPLPDPQSPPVQKKTPLVSTKAEKPRTAAPVPAKSDVARPSSPMLELKIMVESEEEVAAEQPQVAPVTDARLQPDAMESAPVHEMNESGNAMSTDLENEGPVPVAPMVEEQAAMTTDVGEKDILDEAAPGGEVKIEEAPVEDTGTDAIPEDAPGGEKISWLGIVAAAEFVLIIMLGVLVFRRKKQEKVVQEGGEGTNLIEGSGTDPISSMTSKGYKDEVSLCGSIESMSLFAVVEILLAKRESGLLSVSLAGQEAVGSITIHDGEVIDACHDGQRGEAAFSGLLEMKTGLFMFVRGDTGDYERTINESTVSLLMKAGPGG